MADAVDGWLPWTTLRRAASAAAVLPLAVTFVALGAGLLVGRSLANLAEHVWRRPSPRRRSPSPADAASE